MAVKADFAADFSKWIKGIAEVNGSLEKLKAVVATTDGSVDSLAKRFDGRKVVGEATKMVAAVEKIGGAAVLTDAEARRVNATVTEAIDKMQRLGGTAPAEMLKLRDATSRTATEIEKTDKQTGLLGTAIGKIGPLVAASFSISAIIKFASATFDAASAIDDMAKRTGLSIEAAQRFAGAARATGADVGAMEQALKRMNASLANPSASFVSGLRDAGLSLQELRSLSPDEAFRRIADAIGEAGDIGQSTALTIKLLGKGATDLVPAFREGFGKATDSVSVMSDESVRRLDSANKFFERVGNRVKIFGAETLSAFIPSASAIDDNASAFDNLKDSSMRWSNVTNKLVNPVAAELGQQQYQASLQAKRLTEEINRQVPALVNMANAGKKSLVPTLPGLDDVAASFDKIYKATGTNLTNMDRLADAFQAQVDILTGKALSNQVAELARQYDAAQKQGGLTAYQTELLSKKLAELRVQGAALPPELMKLAIGYEESNRKAIPLVGTLKSVADAMKAVHATAMSSPPESLIVTPLVTSIRSAFNAVKGIPLSAAPPMAASYMSAFSKVIQGLPGIIIGAIQGGGDALQASISHVGASIGGWLQKSVTGSANPFFKTKLGSMIAESIPGIGAAIGPVLNGVFNKLFGSAGRDAVKSFAQTFGGFDALREKLNALGAEGERLWIALTQGVGKNNKAQAEAAIKAIQDALARAEEEARKLREEIAGIESELADLRSRSEPTFRDMEEAARAFGVEMSRLGPAFQQQRLTERAREIYDAFDTLRRGGADTTVILEGMADEINDLVLQSLQFGTTIPENFRPLIQSLLESGQLVDENGEKLTDLGNIRFGDAVKSQWEVIADRVKDLTDALQKLVEKLNGPVINAAQNVAREFGNLPGEIDVRLGVVRNGEVEDIDLPEYATGTKGVTGRYFQNFGAGKLAMLHGNEAVVPQAQAQEFADAVGGGNGDVVAELSALRSDFVAMPRLIARAVRDAILVAT